MEVGLECFRDVVCGEGKEAIHVIIAMARTIYSIDRERDENLVDKALLKQTVDMYIEIGMEHYANAFEKAMLDGAEAYYSRKASQWILEDSCPEYMIKVEECLKKEKARVAHYMHSSSEAKLLDELFLKENSGFRVLLRDDKMEDLSRMNRLLEKVPDGTQLLADGLKQFVSDEGMVLIKQADDAMSNKAEKSGAQAQELVPKIIELHERSLGYVVDCFKGESIFQKAVKKAFEMFCNKTAGGCTMAEMLALYCDDVLRKAGAEKLSSEATKESLDKSLSLIKYITEKDLFVEFHSKKLARRLLFERSPQYDHKQFALSKLKQQFSYVSTLKLEGMVTDMALAKERQNAFQEYLDFTGTYNLGIDFAVTAITAGLWPSYKSCDLNLPEEMANCVQAFKDYNESLQGCRKKHSWVFSQGNCNIKGNFENKTIELVVGTYQAAVLLLFNDAERLSFSEMKTQLHMGEDDLTRVLFSLSCAKYNILNKHPNTTKSISSGDYFEFNSNFTTR